MVNMWMEDLSNMIQILESLGVTQFHPTKVYCDMDGIVMEGMDYAAKVGEDKAFYLVTKPATAPYQLWELSEDGVPKKELWRQEW